MESKQIYQVPKPVFYWKNRILTGLWVTGPQLPRLAEHTEGDATGRGSGGDVHEAPGVSEGKGKLTRDGPEARAPCSSPGGPLTDLKGHEEGRTDAVCVSGGNKTRSTKIQFLFRKAFSSTLDVSNVHPWIYRSDTPPFTVKDFFLFQPQHSSGGVLPSRLLWLNEHRDQMERRLMRSSPQQGAREPERKNTEACPTVEHRHANWGSHGRPCFPLSGESQPLLRMEETSETQRWKEERGGEGDGAQGGKQWVSRLHTWLLLILETCPSQFCQELEKVAFS